MITTPRQTPAGKLPALLSWAAGAAAVAAAWVCIYYWMFSRFSPWDDDGYLLIGVRSLLHGRRLYDEIYSQYGPFYYLVHWVTYSAIGQPVSHDVQRFIGMAVWICAAILWGRTCYLLTNSLVWSALGFVLAVKLLEFFPWSAGHPEEICMGLLAAIAAVACGLRAATARRDAEVLAFLVAALALTKVNIGLYIGVAVGLFLLRVSAPSRWRRAAEVGLSGAGLLVPAALMSTMFGFDWARNYAIVATLMIAAAIWMAHTGEPVVCATGRIWLPAGIAFLGCTVLVILPFVFHGTTPGALLQMTVLQHAGTARNWYLTAHIGYKVLLRVVGSLALVGIAGWRARSADSRVPEAAIPHRLPGWARLGLLVLKALCGLTCLWALTTRNIRADNPLIFAYCAPFAWLILAGTADETARRTRAARIAMCFLAVFTYLYAFPVAGAQVLFASVPAGIVAIVLLRDSIAEIANSYQAAWTPGLLRMGPALGCALVVALFSLEIYDGHQRWAGGVSLGMPGAARIRVEPEEAATYRWIAGQVHSCSALYSMPGQFSLNFWTALDSPTELTAGNWVGLLDARQQRSVIRDLSGYPGLCIVYNPGLVEVWRRGQDLSQSPLAQYIRTEFVTVAGSDGYYILKRKRD